VRVRAGERIVRLHSELLAAKEELLQQTRTDPLTGVLNRRALFSIIEKELNRSLRTKQELSLSMLDIDHFKKINDTYGHMAGDEVLKEVTKRIGKAIRIYDFIGRFGGEEFVIVLPGVKESDACITFERIRSVIADEKISVKGSDIYTTVSQGVMTWDGRTNADELIELIDKALYQAKENGRNRVEKALVQV